MKLLNCNQILGHRDFQNSRLIRRNQQKNYKTSDNLLSCQPLLTIALECFLCLSEAVIESYSCMGDSVQFI